MTNMIKRAVLDILGYVVVAYLFCIPLGLLAASCMDTPEEEAQRKAYVHEQRTKFIYIKDDRANTCFAWVGDGDQGHMRFAALAHVPCSPEVDALLYEPRVEMMTK